MMKRLLFTAAWLTALCTAAVSCRNEEKQPVRIICGAIDTIEYTGGKTEIPFSSSAPLNTEPVTEAGWISDLTIGQSSITFIAEENTGAGRTAVIIINIPPDITPVFTSAGEGAEYSETDRTVSIKVTQKAAGENPPERDMAIEITVNRKDFHSVNVSFIPADDRMTYIARIVEKEYFDTFSSDEEYIQDEVDEFMAIAESNGVDPSVVISANLRQNAIENLDIDGLKASTGYCIYAYGLEPDGSVTTGLCKESVYTDEAAKVDFGFSFEVVPQDYEAMVTITTESAGDTYYWSTMTLEDWNAYPSEDDIIAETVETLDFAVEVMGDSYSYVGAVFGATYPEMVPVMRKIMPKAYFLVPGYGAQGAKGADLVNFFNPDGLGAIVNSSRGIIAAWQQEKYAKFGAECYADASRQAVKDMIEDISGALAAAKKGI